MSAEAPMLHEDCWLLLPWLANGRLSASERTRVEEHVRGCERCAHEIAWQQAVCQALAEPDRVTYAPGPSFRKLMERIGDGRRAGTIRSRAARSRALTAAARAAWRPPGFAWAASFLLVIALGALAPLAFRWSQPLYVTHTAPAADTADVLHVAFERSLPIGEVEELLRSAGARIVEGPGSSGIFGVAPVAAAAHDAAANAGAVSSQMRTLAARLRADARVRWVEPLAVREPAEGAQQPRAPSH